MYYEIDQPNNEKARLCLSFWLFPSDEEEYLLSFIHDARGMNGICYMCKEKKT
jgi:hypothetical protein